jgi:hypothetical protein
MSMRKAADNIEDFRDGNIGFAPERPLDQVNDVRGKVRDITQSLVIYPVAIAVGAAQQVGQVNLVVAVTLYRGYVNRAISRGHSAIIH